MIPSPMNQAILDILDERGQMTEPELRELVFYKLGHDNWMEFIIVTEFLLQEGGIGISPRGDVDIFYKRVRTRPVSLIPVEID